MQIHKGTRCPNIRHFLTQLRFTHACTHLRNSFLKHTSCAHSVHRILSSHGSIQNRAQGVSALGMPGSSNMLHVGIKQMLCDYRNHSLLHVGINQMLCNYRNHSLWHVGSNRCCMASQELHAYSDHDIVVLELSPCVPSNFSVRLS